MAEYLTKHEPVDDYPYICYASEDDANAGSISNGGGFFDVGFTITVEEGDPPQLHGVTDKTAGEIFQALDSGHIVVFRGSPPSPLTGDYRLSVLYWEGGTDHWDVVTCSAGNDNVPAFDWSNNESADGYLEFFLILE